MAPGTTAELFKDFELNGFDSKEARASAPLAVLFWRTGCSTSRLTIPFWQRLAERYPEARVVAICQDDEHRTAEWCNDNGITLPQLIDAPTMAITRQFGVDVVPAYWVADTRGRILIKGYGWERRKLEQVNDLLALQCGTSTQPLVTDDDSVPESKPG